jgi:hypothetical protein
MLAHRVLLIASLVACSTHQRRIDTARHDGNEPLAACFEACKPDDNACVEACQQEHPTKLQHRIGATFKPVIDGGKQLGTSIAITLHPLAVQDARAAGNEPLAACYEGCSPTAKGCLEACEREHSRPADAERRREMLALIAKIGIEAYKQEREQKAAWAASNGPNNDPSVATAGASKGSAASGSPSKQPASGEEASSPLKNIHFGKSCSQCDTNIKHGLACTIPAKAVCGEGELTKGSGFCAARKTDKSGSCSARCTGSRECPTGYSCSDLGTGMSVCTR